MMDGTVHVVPPEVTPGGVVIVEQGKTTGVEHQGAVIRKRETWSSKIDFLLALIGFSVGLGNVWRFPYLCYKNGGGAFLIPYLICVLLGGVPMLFLEVALGQFMQQGGIKAWLIVPLFQGIGYATTVIVFLLNCYYNVILAWAFYFLFASFTSRLPWSHCDNKWNKPTCVTSVESLNASANGTLLSIAETTDPATEFWDHKVLGISDSITETITVKWDLCLCLLLAWIVVYFCIWKGIRTSGKVMYFTATAPYVLMLILLIRGVTLPGAKDGILFYIKPSVSKMRDIQVWVDAGTQIFFSYSISLGTLTALGSYNKYHHNSYRDSILFAVANSGTSIFAGFVIFSVLGFMAHQQKKSVELVTKAGPGLAFIAYPQAVAEMPVAPLWSILFFFMIILLGLDSQFVGVEGFITAVSDIFYEQLHKGRRREIFILAVCAVSFLIGLSMVTHGGMFVFQLFDYYSGSRIILLLAFFQLAVIGWVYGAERFYRDITDMLGFRINPFMKICWLVCSPTFCLVMFGFVAYTHSELTYNRTYHYPQWAIAIGWIMACISIAMIPILMVIKICQTPGTFLQRLRFLLTPQIPPKELTEDEMRQGNPLPEFANGTKVNKDDYTPPPTYGGMYGLGHVGGSEYPTLPSNTTPSNEILYSTKL